jgi:hypothetical protein
MQQLEVTKFPYNGKTYEIKVFHGENGFIVQAFLNGRRANGYSYSVDYDTNFKFEWDNGYEAFSHLIEVAKADIKSGMWEKFVAARNKK